MLNATLALHDMEKRSQVTGRWVRGHKTLREDVQLVKLGYWKFRYNPPFLSELFTKKKRGVRQLQTKPCEIASEWMTKAPWSKELIKVSQKDAFSVQLISWQGILRQANNKNTKLHRDTYRFAPLSRTP